MGVNGDREKIVGIENNMRRLSLFIFFLLLLMPAGCVENQSQLWQQGARLLEDIDSTGQPVTKGEIGRGLKEALKVGTGNVVVQLGQVDGFNRDPSIHIPLPAQLQDLQATLDRFGFSYMLDDLELKLNRAAEVAAPKAKALFWQAITEMTFNDVMDIYHGTDDAATRYFQKKMTPALAREMSPVISNSLAQVGAIQSYDRAIGKYQSLPYVPDIKADLTSYVVDKGMNGLFFYIAREEKAIRHNPVKRTTALLRRVFGS